MGVPYTSIHYCQGSLHPWPCLHQSWLILESGSILHGTSNSIDVFWGLNWLSPSVWPVSIHRTLQKHGTQHITDATYGYLMASGSVKDGHKEGTEYCPSSRAKSTCYWQGDAFQDRSKNSRSFKSVPVWGLHQNPISPNDTVTHPRKLEYSATLPRVPQHLVTKEMTAYWYLNTHKQLKAIMQGTRTWDLSFIYQDMDLPTLT